MSFHPGELEVQQQAGAREAADKVSRGIVPFIPERAVDFLATRKMAVLGTVDSAGRSWASLVAGERGFMSVLNQRTVRLGLLPSTGDPLLENLAVESPIALLAIDFLSPRRLRVNGRGIVKDGAIYIETEQVYSNCRRYIQERIFVGMRQAFSIRATAVVHSSSLSITQIQQISEADTFFIASNHKDHGADVSHKGGNPGFVRVIDPLHLAVSDYNGNRMFNTLGNILLNPHAGLLFIDFDTGRTIQIAGVASIDWNAERAHGFAGAERIIDFEVGEIIDNSFGFPLIAKFRQFSRFNPKL